MFYSFIPRLVYLQEWDWTVLEHVLTALPEVLQNKSLILSANPALNTMTAVLCHMVRLNLLCRNVSPCLGFKSRCFSGMTKVFFVLCPLEFVMLVTNTEKTRIFPYVSLVLAPV